MTESTPAETSIDNGDRRAFDNGAEHDGLFPEGKDIEELPFAQAKARRQVPKQVRMCLAERADAIGAALAKTG